MLVSFDKDRIRVMIYHSSLHISNWPGCSNTISHQCKTCSTSNLEQSTIYRIEIWKGTPRNLNCVGNGKAISICNNTSWCFYSHSPRSFPGSIRFDNLILLTTIIYQLYHLTIKLMPFYFRLHQHRLWDTRRLKLYRWSNRNQLHIRFNLHRHRCK